MGAIVGGPDVLVGGGFGVFVGGADVLVGSGCGVFVGWAVEGGRGVFVDCDCPPPDCGVFVGEADGVLDEDIII